MKNANEFEQNRKEQKEEYNEQTISNSTVSHSTINYYILIQNGWIHVECSSYFHLKRSVAICVYRWD